MKKILDWLFENGYRVNVWLMAILIIFCLFDNTPYSPLVNICGCCGIILMSIAFVVCDMHDKMKELRKTIDDSNLTIKMSHEIMMENNKKSKDVLNESYPEGDLIENNGLIKE